MILDAIFKHLDEFIHISLMILMTFKCWIFKYLIVRFNMALKVLWYICNDLTQRYLLYYCMFIAICNI